MRKERITPDELLSNIHLQGYEELEQPGHPAVQRAIAVIPKDEGADAAQRRRMTS